MTPLKRTKLCWQIAGKWILVFATGHEAEDTRVLTQAMYSGVVMVMCLQQRSETSCAAPVGAQPASSERQSPPRPAGSPHTASSWPSSLRLLAERHLKIGKCVSCTWEFLLFPFNLNNSFATVLDTEWCNQSGVPAHWGNLQRTCDSWSSRLLSYTARSCQMDNTRPSCFLLLSSPSLNRREGWMQSSAAHTAQFRQRQTTRRSECIRRRLTCTHAWTHRLWPAQSPEWIQALSSCCSGWHHWPDRGRSACVAPELQAFKDTNRWTTSNNALNKMNWKGKHRLDRSVKKKEDKFNSADICLLPMIFFFFYCPFWSVVTNNNNLLLQLSLSLSSTVIIISPIIVPFWLCVGYSPSRFRPLKSLTSNDLLSS